MNERGKYKARATAGLKAGLVLGQTGQIQWAQYWATDRISADERIKEEAVK